MFDVLTWTGRILLIIWGIDEIRRGVNPWRRLLGVGVLTWQLVDLLA